MRLAYVSADSGIPVFGRKGASIHIQEVIRALRKRGIEVKIFASRVDTRPPPDLGDVPAHILSSFAGSQGYVSARAVIKANGDLRKALNESGRYDLIYERYSLWSFAALSHARRQAIPGILEVNAPLIEEQARYRHLQNQALAQAAAKKVFTAAKAVIAVSDEVADYVRSFLAPGASGKVHILPNGVNPERFPQGQFPVYPGGPDTFTVGFLGSLKPWHGLNNLIEAFGILHKKDAASRLLIVGDGPERAGLEKSVASGGLGQAAHFAGMVGPDEVCGYLASMDIAVAPYPNIRQFYFSPLKIFEYMAAGLPVVASDIGQIRKLIQHGENGLLVSPGDTRALVEAMDCLRRDVQLRRRLGEKARAAVLEKYTWDKIVGCILDIAMSPLIQESIR